MTTPLVTAFEPDPKMLSSLRHKALLLNDFITAVVKGWQTGIYVYGAGGLGKSHLVLERLEALGAAYRLFNSRMTAKGLFRALAAAPDAVHVLEDMERLTNDRDAQGVLRSALWAVQGRDRVVTWSTANERDGIIFRGGLILLANRPLADLPELRALATRITVYHLQVTDEEITALIQELAVRGYQRNGKQVLQPETCVEVAQHLLSECRDAECPLDLRLLYNAYHDYLLWESGESACHWHDLVSVRVREAISNFTHGVETRSPEEKKRECRQIVREITKVTPVVADQVRLYRERTGKSRADFFRRKREVESGEFDSEVNGGDE